MHKAFTLAEILITLAIIGIVAAMTVPATINKIQDAEYKAAYKKAYSALSQAVALANTENLLTSADSIAPRPTPFDSNFLNIMSKFKILKSCVSGGNNNLCWSSTGEKAHTFYPSINALAFIDSSGMAWSQYWAGALMVFVDTNGFEKPNQWGKDRFYFYVRDKAGLSENSMGIPIKVVPLANNASNVCAGLNKCATPGNYYGTTWLYK